MPIINIKRAYEPPSKTDGYRVLVDRLWPRGIKKADAVIDEWAKDLAELKKNPAVDPFLESHEDKKRITLIYAAKDEAHTHALVLQDM